MRHGVLGILAWVMVGIVPAASAQSDDEKSTAREFGVQGQAALDKGDAKTAEDRFHRAVLIFDNAKAVVPPTLLLGYARGAAKNNHPIEAEEAYNRIIHTGLPPGAPAPFVQALEDAKREVDSVTPHIAHVTINVTGCDNPVVTLDGGQLPSVVLGVKKPVDPGTHEVKATAAGCKAGSTTFNVGDGAEATSSLTLEKETVVTTQATPTPTPTPVTPPPTPTPTETTSSGSGLRTAGWVTTVAGGAVLVMGIATGIVALSQHGDLATACPNGVCPSSSASELDSYHATGTVSTIGFIAGPVLLAAGLTMVFLAPSHKTEKSAWLRPTLGIGSVGLVGGF